MNLHAKQEKLLKSSVEQEKLIKNLTYKSNPKAVKIMREEQNWGEKSKKRWLKLRKVNLKGKSVLVTLIVY